MDICIKTYSLHVTTVTNRGSVNIGNTMNIQYSDRNRRSLSPPPPEAIPPEQGPTGPPVTPPEIPPQREIPGQNPIPPIPPPIEPGVREQKDAGDTLEGGFYSIPTPAHSPLCIPSIPRWVRRL
ncbi:hypothetical protein [Kroppenstedtia sanguinis]|uniref:Uncharacterized protein n=1 Tax=Kroppenstedtia sanguinis TaxID=1380684 RepID=A0ABW4CF08_9BACL